MSLIVKKENQKDITSHLNKYGIAIIPNYLEDKVLTELNKEFELILTSNQKKSLKPIDYSNGRGTVITLSELDTKDYPFTVKVFNADFMKRIANRYFKNKPYVLNKQVYAVNDLVGTKHHANDLHFDVKPTFKFFIYLTDTTAENGAFSCVPGSHKITKELRVKEGHKITYENRHITRELPVKEEDVISIEGVAGTLIIFTTEVFHRAGKVSKGERKVMRGHCRLLDNKSLPKQSFFKKIFSKIKWS